MLFNQGDVIQVIDDDDDDWWKGFKLNKNKLLKEEGYFPRRHVKVMQTNSGIGQQRTSLSSSTIKLEDYPWFSPVDRSTADLILNRITNDNSDTLFMVRCRNDGGYAISIKYNGTVDHIRINTNTINSRLAAPLMLSNEKSEINELMVVYFIDQQHNFNSVVSLVNYYSQNLLKDNFPQLNTTLGLAFRNALPTPISSAVAMHDYNPLSNPNNTGEQIELVKFSKYFVINKELNGWWRVYNSDGLIGYVPGSYLHEEEII